MNRNSKAARDGQSFPCLPLSPDDGIVLFFSRHPVHPNLPSHPREMSSLKGGAQGALLHRQSVICEEHHPALGPACRIIPHRIELEVSVQNHRAHDYMPRRRCDRFLETFLDLPDGFAGNTIGDHLSREFLSAGVLSEVPPDYRQVFKKTTGIPEIKIDKNMVIVVRLTGMTIDNSCHLMPFHYPLIRYSSRCFNHTRKITSPASAFNSHRSSQTSGDHSVFSGWGLTSA
jgi:hypothetical protein